MSKYQDTQEDWEKEFDERWRFGENAPLTNHIADIKSFIKAEIADTRARVKAQAHAKGIEVGKAIGREEAPQEGKDEWLKKGEKEGWVEDGKVVK